MPKLKTNKSARKRFKLTKTGKVKRMKEGARHILTKKSRKRKRSLKTATTVHVPTALAVGLPIFGVLVAIGVFKRVFGRIGGM